MGVPAAGRHSVVSMEVGHGEDPHQLLWQEGYFVQRLLSASGAETDLTITAQVAPHGHPGSHLPSRSRGRDLGLVIPDGVEPMRRQRIAAYAIVLSTRGLLATQFSNRTAVPGVWGLPGGGIDPGETASAAVVREIFEETGQDVVLDHVLDLQSDHWIGRAPNGVIEDFHALRIIYSAIAEHPTDPVVHDTGGTTAASNWVPARRWRRFSWSTGFRAMLAKHLDGLLDEVEIGA